MEFGVWRLNEAHESDRGEAWKLNLVRVEQRSNRGAMSRCPMRSALLSLGLVGLDDSAALLQGDIWSFEPLPFSNTLELPTCNIAISTTSTYAFLQEGIASHIVQQSASKH